MFIFLNIFYTLVDTYPRDLSDFIYPFIAILVCKLHNTNKNFLITDVLSSQNYPKNIRIL